MLAWTWGCAGVEVSRNPVYLPAAPTTHLEVQAVEEGWSDDLIVIIDNEIPVSHILELVPIGGRQLGHIAHSRHKLQPVRSFAGLRSAVHCQTQDGAKQAKSRYIESHLIAQVPQPAVQGALSDGFQEEEWDTRAREAANRCHTVQQQAARFIWLAAPHPYAVVCVVVGETLMSSTTSMLGTS